MNSLSWKERCAGAPPRKLLRAGGASLCSLALIAAGCQPEVKVHRQPAIAASSAVRIATVKPLRKTIERTIEQPASVVAFEHAPLFARITAYVDRLEVDLGDQVRGPHIESAGQATEPGQVLAVLAAPELEAQTHQKQFIVRRAEAAARQAEAAVKLAAAGVVSAQAQQEAAEASLGRTAAQADYFRSQLQRFEELNSRGSVTPKLVDETRGQLAAAEADHLEAKSRVESLRAAVNESKAAREKSDADLAAAKASIDVARADVEHAQAMWQYHLIRAPFDGVVTRRNVHPGHLVQPGLAETPLLLVARTDKLRIVFDIPELDAAFTSPGDRVTIRLPSLGGDLIEAKITRVSWALDQTTRTLRAEVDLLNPSGKLRPGMYGYVSSVVEKRDNVLVLPVSATFADKGQTYCACIESGTLHRRAIQLGLQSGSMVEITRGLTGGEEVVRASGASLPEGQAVVAEAR
ncbi:MAG TPA: efflux RND transporter periplasmic adaptor subunit [Pirellulales bacterium]|nr:efflux RND transporter periplasmic adaptor subunit [Pirellulales bacterium]